MNGESERILRKKEAGGVRLVTLTALALVAFAGNSVLGRLALRGGLLSPDTFTAIRMVSGALALGVFLAFQGKGRQILQRGSWRGGGFLALYMVAFSWGYLGISTGAGALVLFGSVQATLIGWSLVQGVRPTVGQSAGILIALAGLAWLLIAPGDALAPSWGAGWLMALSGVAWGGYTICGKGAEDPLQETAGNFWKGSPLVLAAAMWSWSGAGWPLEGVLFAVASGVLASAVGYAIWYEVIRALSPTNAAGLQLLVPVLASLGGLVFGGEPLTLRLALASACVLGGVALVLGCAPRRK